MEAVQTGIVILDDDQWDGISEPAKDLVSDTASVCVYVLCVYVCVRVYFVFVCVCVCAVCMYVCLCVYVFIVCVWKYLMDPHACQLRLCAGVTNVDKRRDSSTDSSAGTPASVASRSTEHTAHVTSHVPTLCEVGDTVVPMCVVCVRVRGASEVVLYCV